MADPVIVDRALRWWRDRSDRRTEGIVLHAMGERIWVEKRDDFLTAWEFLDESPEFTGDSLSAHCLIEPDGTIVRCVADDAKANHAGHSRIGNLENLNWFFLGVEFLLPGEWYYGAFLREMKRGNVHFTPEQYVAGGWLCADWMRRYEFGRDRIVTHSQVAGDDVRGKDKGKRDPGVGFNHGVLSNEIARHES